METAPIRGRAASVGTRQERARDLPRPDLISSQYGSIGRGCKCRYRFLPKMHVIEGEAAAQPIVTRMGGDSACWLCAEGIERGRKAMR